MQAGPRFHVENLHAQVADDLIRRIASGALATGSQLPAEGVMAAEYGVSVGTLRRAIGEISELGLVERGRGRSTTVADVERAHRTSRTISTVDRDGTRILGESTQHNVRVEQASDMVAAILRQRSPRPILRFLRHLFHEGRRYMVEDVHLPVRREDLESGQARLLELARDLWWKREVAQTKRERLWLEAANAEDAALLGNADMRSVLCIERTLFGTRNLPLEYRVGRCNFGNDLFYVSD